MEFIIHSALGEFTVYFDEEDLQLIKKYNWCVRKNRTKFYVETTIRINKIGHKLSLHKLIMKPPKGVQVDHVDRNPLNNRRNNLRFANASQNNMNKDLQKNNTSGFRGVWRYSRNGKYLVCLKACGKRYTGGKCFETAVEGAIRYNELAKEHFGEFAKLNIIPS